MISSIFGKTKPINFIIVLTFLFVLYWFVHYFMLDNAYSMNEVFAQTLILAVLLFSVFIVDFIVKRNKVTETNAFAILFYAVLVMVFPQTLIDSDAIFCSLFLLLATRRLISIRSLKDIKLKIFDATLWVLVSSLFYEWALLYLILVSVAIYIYEPKNIRNWLVPFAAFFTVFMISYCVLILANNTGYIIEHYTFSYDFNTSVFFNWGNSIKLTVYILIIVLAAIFLFFNSGKAGMGKIVTIRLIALSFVIGLVMNTVMASSDTYPIMVTFFPAVVFVTNFVESIRKPKVKEIVLITTIVVPFIIFLLGIGIK